MPKTVFFRVSANCFCLLEGRTGSLTAFFFTCGVQIGTAGKRSMGTCWLAAERGAGFVVCRLLGNAVWLCNFMGFPFLQQTLKQDHCPLTAFFFLFFVFAFSLLARSVSWILWGGGKQLQPSPGTPAPRMGIKRMRVFPMLPRRCCQRTGKPL